MTPWYVNELIKNNPKYIFKVIFLVKIDVNLILLWILEYRKLWWKCWMSNISDIYLKRYSKLISRLSIKIIEDSKIYWFKFLNTELNFNDKINNILRIYYK